MTAEPDKGLRSETPATVDWLEQHLIEAAESGISERTVLDIIPDAKRKRMDQAFTPPG